MVVDLKDVDSNAEKTSQNVWTLCTGFTTTCHSKLGPAVEGEREGPPADFWGGLLRITGRQQQNENFTTGDAWLKAKLEI